MNDSDTQLPLKHIVEAALLAASEPMNIHQFELLFSKQQRPDKKRIIDALDALANDCQDRGIELKEVASGYRLQVKQEMQTWISNMWQERPAKYSRALLETLALIAYRQPITRGEIEDVRGVSVSSTIIRTMIDRDWIRIVGRRDVPGKPALFGTTKGFLDYFDLANLTDLPTLAEIQDIDSIEPQFDFDVPAEDRQANKNTRLSPSEQADLELVAKTLEDNENERMTRLQKTNETAIDEQHLDGNNTSSDEPLDTDENHDDTPH